MPIRAWPASVDAANQTGIARLYDGVVAAATLFAIGVVVHNADHVRRGAEAVEPDVFWLGTAAVGMEVAIVGLICQRHRTAPLAAAVAGLGLAAGYLFVHFLPERTWLSDPLVAQSDIDRWSVIAASIEVVAALALGLVGLIALRRLGGLRSAARPNPQQRSLRDALLHPVTLTFALTQIGTLAASFAQV